MEEAFIAVLRNARAGNKRAQSGSKKQVLMEAVRAVKEVSRAPHLVEF